MESTNIFQDIPYKSRITPDLRVFSGDDAPLLDEVRQTGVPLIGTHSEVFHCDEVLATTMLLYTHKFQNAAIVRTRNDAVLDTLDIVCDVGAVFDVEKNRFDHHQKSFNTYWYDSDTAENGGIKLSSAGLIYKYFGKEVLTNILKEVWNSEFSEPNLEKIYQKLYSGFFQEIDAIDNGVTLAKDMRYRIVTNLSDRISRFNKEWNAPKDKCQQMQFKKAMRVVEEELMYQIKSISQVFMPARMIVEEAWAKKNEFHPSGEILFMSTPCPWKDHLYELENDNKVGELIKFVLYQDERKMTRVQTVAPKGNFFAQRVTLCKKWHGLRAQELQLMEAESGLKDLEFVHHSGFIGGAWSLETAIKMAEQSIADHKAEQEKIKDQQMIDTEVKVIQ
eukprot:403374276